MNKQTAEYVVIHKNDQGRFQDTIDNLSVQGYTMVGPAQFTMDNDIQERFRYQYFATMERKVEAREEGEI